MVLLYLYFVLAVLVGIVAEFRGRSAISWFLVGLFLTPLIAGLLVMALPNRRGYLVAGHEFWPDSIPSLESLAMPADSTLRIIRCSGWSERLRPYEIFVNGGRLATISRNGVLDFPVPSGPLLIEARTDRGGSRPLVIEAAPDRRVDIAVSNHWGRVLALWGTLFGPDSYLTLRKLPAPDAALRHSQPA